MESFQQTRFFVTGGTLRADAPSYIERRADRELYEGLMRGGLCYVMTSRQIGKSSLMVRTAARLRREGIAVGVLDLTALGRHLTIEQWYHSLLRRLGRSLGQEDALDQLWLQKDHLPPLDRWMTVVRTVAGGEWPVASPITGADRDTTGDAILSKPDRSTAQRAQPGPKLVIFMDEIDAVRGLPFSTDELFAGIRECYNNRSQDPVFDRLTFCLLGVASPADLIQDPRATPFNIGRRIELTDFTEAEAAPLAAGLGVGGRGLGVGNGAPEPLTLNPQRLLERVLYWTGGHPYLTQRLCRAVAEAAAFPSAPAPNPERPTPALVDRLCRSLFLTPGARAQDDNLLFVRERLLRDEEGLASLLDLYGKVRAGKRVPMDETQPLIERLCLSGIVRAAIGPGVSGGRLVVRNRIYERVFDRKWIADHLPGAELRRQRAAYRRGLARAAAVAVVVVAGMGFLANMAAEQADRARVAEAEARTEVRRNSRLLYDANMTLAQQAWDAGNIGRLRQLLAETRDSPDRGFEWYYWRQQTQLHLRTLLGHRGRVQGLAFSPDGRRLVSGSEDQTAVVWDLSTGHKRVTFTGHISQPQSPGITSIAWSPNGRQIVSVGGEGVARVWSPADGRELFVLRGHQARSAPIAFSPNGDRILTIDQDGGEAIWDAATGRLLRTLPARQDGIRSTAGSLDGRHTLDGSEGQTAVPAATIWDAATWPPIPTLPENAVVLAFSRDGRQVITAGNGDGTAHVWNTRAGHSVLVLRGHTGWVRSAAFSLDGDRILTGGTDATARVWDAHTGRQLFALQPGTGEVSAVAFAPNGQRIATSGDDGTARIWDASLPPGLTLQRFPHGTLPSPAFTPTGTLVIARSSPNGIAVGDLAGPTHLIPVGNSGLRGLIRISPDAGRFATGDWVGGVTVWDGVTGRALVHLASLPGGVGAVAFSPDGRQIAIGQAAYGMWAGPGIATVWDTRSGRRLATLRGHSSVFAMAYSPDGRRILTGGGDGTARLWDAATGRLILCLAGHHATVLALAFSADGQWIATGARSGEVVIWNARTGEVVDRLTGHQRGVVAVWFSPDGQRLATASDDQMIKLWDTWTGREILSKVLPDQLFGLAGDMPPEGASFSPRMGADCSPMGTIGWPCWTLRPRGRSRRGTLKSVPERRRPMLWMLASEPGPRDHFRRRRSASGLPTRAKQASFRIGSSSRPFPCPARSDSAGAIAPRRAPGLWISSSSPTKRDCDRGRVRRSASPAGS
jgi:WD40 repeat protein